MRGLILALGFLTRLPVPRIAADRDAWAASIRWYPAVGLVIGALLAGAWWLGTRIDPWLGPLAALVIWVGITGALHLDGLGDLADGCGAAHGDRSRLLAVLADPHVGSFGVVAIGLQLIAKLVLLHALASPWPLLLVPFAARIGPLAWARWLAPLHAGMGAAVAGAVRTRDLIGWALVLAAAAVAVPALLAGYALIAGFALWLRVRIGGVNGDCHGAGIELVESGLLLALVVAGAV